MWQQTERLAVVWLRITLALVTGVAVVMTVYGLGSVQFKLAAVAAVLLDLLTIRALFREWAWQARGAWWRFW
ncbi:MAG: hypothetical protein ABR608_14945 [Pseudonocardiaceae bacterium]